MSNPGKVGPGPEGLGAQWQSFFGVLLRPIVLALVSVAVLVGVATTRDADPALQAALLVILSVVTGVTGGIIGAEMLSAQARRDLLSKGKGAIRSLEHLRGGLVSIRERARTEVTDAPPMDGLSGARARLREIARGCERLQEEVALAMADWTDILPSASQAVELPQAVAKISALEKLVGELQAAVRRPGISMEDRTTVTRDLAEAQRELAAARLDRDRGVATLTANILGEASPRLMQIRVQRLPGTDGWTVAVRTDDADWASVDMAPSPLVAAEKARALATRLQPASVLFADADGAVVAEEGSSGQAGSTHGRFNAWLANESGRL